MTDYVLDTNIVTFILYQKSVPVQRMRDVVAVGDRILGCPVVWYEVRRGLLCRDARRRMQTFERLFTDFDWDDYTLHDWALAAQLWSERRAQGRPIHDADLLIGVFARNRNAVLVTDNEKDFAGLGLTVQNWTLPE
ncbi:MAG: PIN domain-containing protein [Anaerolineae bacterium]|nr:PIN domain-containing protein [Anaerolineae bacterium]